jgi:hypothetical protein
LSIRHINYLILFYLILFLSIINIVSTGSLKIFNAIIFLFLLTSSILLILRSKEFNIINFISNKTLKPFVLISLFLFLNLISYSRGISLSYLSFNWIINWILLWSALFLFIFQLFSYELSLSYFHSIYIKLYNSLYLYIIINLIFFLLGFNQANNIYGDHFHPSKILEYFGVEWSRTLYPLAPGINSFGVILGLSFLSSFIIMLNQQKYLYKLSYFIIFIISFFMLLTVDSRGPIIISFILIVLHSFKWMYKYFKYILIIVPILPALLVFITYNLDTEIFDYFRRSNLLLGGREVLWFEFYTYFKNFSFMHFFGYGIFGQAASGISSNYTYLFTWEVMNPELITLHNTVLQTITDIGFIGISILLWLLYLMIDYFTSIINKNLLLDNVAIKVALFSLIYLVLIGATEVSINVYNFYTFYIFVFTCFYFLFLKKVFQ